MYCIFTIVYTVTKTHKHEKVRKVTQNQSAECFTVTRWVYKLIQTYECATRFSETLRTTTNMSVSPASSRAFLRSTRRCLCCKNTKPHRHQELDQTTGRSPSALIRAQITLFRNRRYSSFCRSSGNPHTSLFLTDWTSPWTTHSRRLPSHAVQQKNQICKPALLQLS